MSQHQNTKPITPASVNTGGLDLQVFAHVPKDEFPHGMELVVFKPGTLEPVGKFLIAPGSVLGLIPPGAFADHIVGQVKQAAARSGQQPGIGLVQ